MDDFLAFFQPFSGSFGPPQRFVFKIHHIQQIFWPTFAFQTGKHTPSHYFHGICSLQMLSFRQRQWLGSTVSGFSICPIQISHAKMDWSIPPVEIGATHLHLEYRSSGKVHRPLRSVLVILLKNPSIDFVMKYKLILFSPPENGLLE